MNRTLLLLVMIGAVLVTACQPVDIAPETTTDDANGGFSALTDTEDTTSDTAVEQDPVSLEDRLEELEGETDTDDTSVDAEELEADLPTKTVKEGEVVQLNSRSARDPDADRLSYVYPEQFDATGRWVTTVGDAGEYIFPLQVTDGDFVSEVQFKVIVLPVNTAPTISNFDNVVVDEGETISFDPQIVDREGDSISFTYSGFMTSSLYTTNFEDAGEYTVLLTATDGTLESTKEVTVTIRDANRAPVISQLQNQEIIEGETLTLDVDAQDLDGDSVTISFSAPFDSAGRYTAQDGDAGVYAITVFADDGETQVQERFTLTVRQRNKAPFLTVTTPVTILEGETLTLDVETSDPDGDDVVVTYSGYMNARSKFIDYDQEGTHEVVVTASDGVNSVVETVTVVVENVNRPPEFTGDIFV